MQDKEHKEQTHLGPAQSILPVVLAAAALLIYVLTLNRWVTLASLPYVAKIVGWDWAMPVQAPLFFALTYPIRSLPGDWQLIALNLFAAVSGALTLALLARSVILLPHDRTVAQRQRERSEFSLLSIPSAWLPPVLAVAVCALELSFWQQSTAATTEILDVLIFAYVIRCLLEYRIDPRESWLLRFAFVYGLGVTNNWAMIGFFPCFLIALIWIMGVRFFRVGFIFRMLLCGLAGLSLYLLLPILWSLYSDAKIGFWQVLRANIANQKGLLFAPELRIWVLFLSLTSILPLLIIGIRWPSSFGDTSAAGAMLTNLMFRTVHVVFLVLCMWVAFDQRFSPPARVTSKFGLVLLPFYYMGALCVGYFSGYALLVFGEHKSSKMWKRRSGGASPFDWIVPGAVWLALAAVPMALIYRNLPTVRANNGALLRDFAKRTAESLPASGAVVLSDDPSGLFLLERELTSHGATHKHVLVHSRSLPIPTYHRHLLRRYPGRWPNWLDTEDDLEAFDDATLLRLVTELAKTNQLYYLHPSFGFYFERFYPRAQGLVYQLNLYPTNMIVPPPSETAEIQSNQSFWNSIETPLRQLPLLTAKESRDALYLSKFYARALNFWGVTLQRQQRTELLKDASKDFRFAGELFSNNIPALVNFEYNKTLQTGEQRTNQISRIINDKFGLYYRSWDTALLENGPFDYPDFMAQLGQMFTQQGLYRQAIIQYDRIKTLEPTNHEARLTLANLYLQDARPEKTMEELAALKSMASLPAQAKPEIVRLEAAVHLAKNESEAAEKILVDALAKSPDHPRLLDALIMLYGQSKRFTNALAAVDQLLKLYPDNTEALVNQATLYFNSSNYVRALESLDRVLQNHPKDMRTRLYKIFMLTETKDYKNAQTEVNRVLELDPDNAEALLYDGVIQIDTKAYDKALAPLNRLLKLQPTNWKALRNRAIANINRNQLDAAEADYVNLKRQQPKYYVAYYGFASIADKRNDREHAIRNYELYLKYLPDVSGPDMAPLASEKQRVVDRLKELKGAQR